MVPVRHVAACITADGLLLIDRNRGSLFTSNNVAASIWRHIETNTPVDDIAVAVAAECEVPLDVAHKDVVDFVTQLRERGLVHD